MEYVCENESEDVLRVLASDNTIMNLILEIGTGTSSLARGMKVSIPKRSRN